MTKAIECSNMSASKISLLRTYDLKEKFFLNFHYYLIKKTNTYIQETSKKFDLALEYLLE